MTEIPIEDRVKLSPPPHTASINFTQQWILVTPAVYRYEDEVWIDQFLDTGKLRLSTFAKFSKYKDEIRGDSSEGSGFGYGETKDSKSVLVYQTEGLNALVLCCTHRLDKGMRDKFGRNSAFQITNTVGFAREISRQLVGFRHGLEGSCIYRDRKLISRALDYDFEKYKLPDGNIDMQGLFDAGNALGGPELVLLKNKNYQQQAEYRLLWEVDTLKADYIDVVAPNARQYCRKVEDKEY
ncbi:hypothetical protein [Rhizobium sp. K102]|uniref:hypothetical protein n=1 Tax=Rhizobium sp. K102 TaxID=2918527 RepID=UPI001EFB2385|nr:hypothetical protein [Rhizobium sp. K102]ULR44203.1 hypothetical protein MHI61_24180 [Rhizobium sp. K102]